jgi:hypothetical protein
VEKGTEAGYGTVVEKRQSNHSVGEGLSHQEWCERLGGGPWFTVPVLMGSDVLSSAGMNIAS